MYAYCAKNETALADYLAFQNRKSTLKVKEKEVISLVTSQIKGCRYCQSAHTVLGKMSSFTDEQVVELCRGSASFNPKFDALVKITASIIKNRGKATEESKATFFSAGYTEFNLIDVIMVCWRQNY